VSERKLLGKMDFNKKETNGQNGKTADPMPQLEELKLTHSASKEKSQ